MGTTPPFLVNSKGDKKIGEGVWCMPEGSQPGRWENVTTATETGVQKGLSKKATSGLRNEVWGAP